MLHRRWTALGAAVIVATGLALAAGSAHAISGGRPAPAAAYPFSASLSMPSIPRTDGSHYASACSGALVAPRWVITAGHCAHNAAGTRTSGSPSYRIDVTIGETRSGPTHRVVEVVQNPHVDMALVELDSAVTGVAPVTVSPGPPAIGESLVLAGWGSTDGVEDPAHRPAQLETAAYRVTGVGSSQLSATPTGSASACPFDSGAPYLTVGGTPQLVATEISGPTCPSTGVETTARGDVQAAWIAAQTGTRG